MKDKILSKFLQPISESYQPKLEFLSEDDLAFLQSIGNYVYEKMQDPKEARKNLQYGIGTASRRSQLFSELRKASQDRLSSHQSIFAEVDISNFNEEDIGDGLLNQSCSHMGNLMYGSVDGHLSESSGGRKCVGEYAFEADNAMLYFPVVSEWLNKHLSESQHSLALTEFLRSVQDALRICEKSQEVICKHNPENLGKIAHVR